LCLTWGVLHATWPPKCWCKFCCFGDRQFI
jgi:hypothetical protein